MPDDSRKSQDNAAQEGSQRFEMAILNGSPTPDVTNYEDNASDSEDEADRGLLSLRTETGSHSWRRLGEESTRGFVKGILVEVCISYCPYVVRS
jgi:hypothetical protein